MSALEGLLACPSSHGALAFVDGEWRSDTAKYPVRADLPCLYAAPEAALGEWRLRFQREVALAKREAGDLRKHLASAGKRLPAASRERMAKVAEGRARYAQEVAQVLGPFSQGPVDEAALQADLATLIALRTRLPPTQGVLTYTANIFRDWVWGEAENQASLEAVRAVLPAETHHRLVLGSGAGRLSYDLHQHLADGLTLALDINPFLGRIGQLLSAGGEIVLHEFPLAPKGLADVAVAHRLKAPAAAHEGLHFLLGDVHRPPVLWGSMDLVLTPWVVDIVDEDFARQARRINRLLKPGGRWISFGSLSFSGAELATRYCLEEVMALVEEAGFATPEVVEHELPYLRSPHSRHGRVEQVVVLAADKTRDARADADHVSLPDWITVGESPVPLSESFKLQAASTRIHAFLMSMIDGQRSIADMAALMEAQKLMPQADAREAIRGFLIRMYEESRQS
ncbi:MAG: class I SAM-dependent methyltransferase [Pseudomonadota bacterium]